MLATALVAEAAGDCAAAVPGFTEATAWFAARRWPMEHATGLAGIGRCQVAAGEMAAGLASLARARALLEPLRAAPAIDEIDRFVATVDGSTAAAPVGPSRVC